MEKHLKIGVSACLLGEKVRFNGGHCHDRFLTQSLSPFAEFIPSCPEAAIGMGIPREAVRLERFKDGSTHLIAPKSKEDFTKDMEAYASVRAHQLEALDLDGYIFKKNSPSCGVFRVKTYVNDQPAERNNAGLFAKALMEKFPKLPVEEDGRLNDPMLRENFLERVFAFRRVKDLFKNGWTRREVVAFQGAEKMLLLAHSPLLSKELGQLVGQIKSYKREEFKQLYIQKFMQCLAIKPSKGKQANALMHMAGHLKQKLSANGRLELNKTIKDYQNGVIPFCVPIALLSHMIRRCNIIYLSSQSYLSPCPHELGLRNYIRG
ncbi:conserved hypothetical protein [Candidatus Terasakiella magnetica]|uniref:DUF1722 domain-containing protein n=1 Tax=Candidatus Terasakiella magnetica TaxID=1867952 RepID=A0A1C3RCZ6_9PROT|nr:DUF523 and DUF1722 domain-containing protein [Candidatus Terasakiella magnetica]SCA55149.1 conserved hypothetical protein [Candidatus Terasakiella magnetica]